MTALRSAPLVITGSIIAITIVILGIITLSTMTLDDSSKFVILFLMFTISPFFYLTFKILKIKYKNYKKA